MQINVANEMAANKIMKVRGGKRNTVKKAMAFNAGVWCTPFDAIRVSARGHFAKQSVTSPAEAVN